MSPSHADFEKLGGINLGEGLPGKSQPWLLMGIPGEVSWLPGSHPRPRGPSGPGIPLSESSSGDWVRARVAACGTTFRTKLLAQFLSPLPLQEPSLCPLLPPRKRPQALKYSVVQIVRIYIVCTYHGGRLSHHLLTESCQQLGEAVITTP